MHAVKFFWAKFGLFRGYLGQVGDIIWAKVILPNFLVVSSGFVHSVIILFFLASYQAIL